MTPKGTFPSSKSYCPGPAEWGVASLIYIYIYTYIYIYIYIERERERYRYLFIYLFMFRFIFIFIYIYKERRGFSIYIYIYIYVCIYIYTYIYIYTSVYLSIKSTEHCGCVICCPGVGDLDLGWSVAEPWRAFWRPPGGRLGYSWPQALPNSAQKPPG